MPRSSAGARPTAARRGWRANCTRSASTARGSPHELANTEDRIAAARRFFNANIREMNGLCQQFPTSIVGSIFHFEPGTFFELSSEAERVVPRVQMGPQTQPGVPE